MTKKDKIKIAKEIYNEYITYREENKEKITETLFIDYVWWLFRQGK